MRSIFAAALSLLVLLTAADCGSWRTPLEQAVEAGDLSRVQKLLRSGANPNQSSSEHVSPLDLAAMRPGSAAIIRALTAAGANPNWRGPDEHSCSGPVFNEAAGSGDVENVQALLDAGASMKQRACSRLILAWLNLPMIKYLAAHGYDVKAVDQDGRNELHIGLMTPRVPAPENIEYLLRAGIPADVRDQYGKTPIDYWREPRHFEQQQSTSWLGKWFSDSKDTRTERENRAKISKLLGVVR